MSEIRKFPGTDAGAAEAEKGIETPEGYERVSFVYVNKRDYVKIATKLTSGEYRWSEGKVVRTGITSQAHITVTIQKSEDEKPVTITESRHKFIFRRKEE